MFSIVMMMALSGGAAETPAFGGGCRGCNGCNSCSSCRGCGGCFGGGRGCKGCHGCNSCGGYSSCCGCCGTAVYSCGGCYGGAVVPVPPPAKDMPKKEAMAAPATIYVSLPAEAKLTVDETPTNSTSTTRVLVSPILELGHDYHYTLKAEIVRDGKPQVATQRITVRAGEETRVNLQFPVDSVAQR